MSEPLRVALTPLGCKVNLAEMADLAGRLAAAGCDVVDDSSPADVHVLNSCTVTLQADATTRQRLSRLRREAPDAHLVLTGCSVDGNPERYLASDPAGQRRLVPGVDAVFSNAEKHRIAEHVIALAGAHRGEPRPVPALRARAFIKVQDGCDHRCTYCIVWRARGASTSHPVAAVVAEAQAALATGHRELVLTGVDLGSYGREHSTTLAALVRTLLAEIGDRARLRLSSVNANDITAELAALTAHPRLCSHWHIPLQSGSDRVLKAMHRGYRRRQFLRVVEQLREADPRTEITTDVMVAFPGESEEDHRETLDLIEQVGMLHCHTFRYSPRPGTPAAEADARIDDTTAQRRSRELRRVAAGSGAARRRGVVGTVLEVVWDRVDGDGARGVSDTWHTVVCPPTDGVRLGDRGLVRADRVEGEVLRGAVVGHPDLAESLRPVARLRPLPLHTHE